MQTAVVDGGARGGEKGFAHGAAIWPNILKCGHPRCLLITMLHGCRHSGQNISQADGACSPEEPKLVLAPVLCASDGKMVWLTLVRDHNVRGESRALG